MLSFTVLTFVNLVILLAPPGSVRILLELMRLPFHARMVLLFVVLFNVLLSMAFERWGVQVVAKVVGSLMRVYKDRRRHRDGKAYKLLVA
jgi:cation-transporting P-type ATPase 13A2